MIRQTLAREIWWRLAISVEVADQHDVSRLRKSCQRQLFPIRGPVIGNNFVREPCDLTRRATGQRLTP